ncbi:bacillithiol biosynthesis cysteine-adding enzyme BshC [Lewinellaceae bacterium SD302]|nr:bacillithiol biosynthesis cysteine-adding enzyme BshC [Lewinellaceae bacterium SD302]
MQIHHKPFKEIPQFSDRDVAYATADERLRPFYKYPVTKDAFGAVMQDKKNDATDRQLLVGELRKQYDQLPQVEAVDQQLKRLEQDDTFTVITAHQPSLFTGPLYFIYKICSVINLSRQLNEAYPDQHVVPVFITGGEDHDFEEIQYANLFGNKLIWENEEAGAVGAMSTATLTKVLDELKDILGDREAAASIYARIEKAFTSHDKYGPATVALVHDLFGAQGLVVADMARPAYKRAFLPIMRQEIFEQSSQPLVEKTQAALTEAGFSAQAHAREINFFYLREGLRERIVLENDRYKVLNTAYDFSRDELEAELETHPEFFSPNVVMRPLFQEKIFPNLAYIGGGGELAYWLERKEQFAAFGLNFPMLIRRNSVLWVDKGNQKKLAKAGVTIDELFGDVELLIRDYVEKNSENELSLESELEQFEAVFQSIASKAEEIDPNLKKAVLAEHARQAKSIENLEGRIRRTEKQRFDTTINQIRGLKDKLFPGNGLQERTDNFLNIYVQEGESMFEVLIENLDPLKDGMIIIEA